MTGRVEVSGPVGSADPEYSIRGPENSARVYVSAFNQRGRWKLNAVIVDVDDGSQTINVLRPAEEER